VYPLGTGGSNPSLSANNFNLLSRSPSSFETKHPQKPVEYFGREATAFTRRMVQGKKVRLEFDQANAHIVHKDKYKRTLAYVFLGDGTFLNAEIIKQGYGFAYTRFPFKYLDEFRHLSIFLTNL